MTQPTAEVVDRLFRRESGRAVATLIRAIGSFDLAEDAVQDAFAIALERWPRDGVPDNPGAWITTTARNRAIDRLRRDSVGREKSEGAEQLRALETLDADEMHEIPDERLRLIFTCCHPALADGVPRRPDAAHGGRPVDAGDRARVPVARADRRPAARAGEAEDPRRRHPVPGASQGPARGADRRRAHRALPRLQRGLQRDERARSCGSTSATRRSGSRAWSIGCFPTSPRSKGCSRSCCCSTPGATRATDDRGEIVLLEDQDRCPLGPRHDRRGGRRCSTGRSVRRRPGPYQLQAAIAALHARAPRPEDTDWPQIASLYARLAVADPSPVVELNRAVAVAMADGPAAGLSVLEPLAPDLDALPPLPRRPRRPAAPARAHRRGPRRVRASPRPRHESGRATLPRTSSARTAESCEGLSGRRTPVR